MDACIRSGSMHVGVIVGEWKLCDHQCVGVVTQFVQALRCRGFTSPAHVALLFSDIDDASAVLAHACGVRTPRVPHTFDVLTDRAPAFVPLNAKIWTSARRLVVYPLTHSPAANETVDDYAHSVFQACIRSCRQPFNYSYLTYFNACFPCFCFDVSRICASHNGTLTTNCIGLLLRLLAQGVDPQVKSDDEVITILRLRTPPMSCRCGPTPLVAYDLHTLVHALPWLGRGYEMELLASHTLPPSHSFTYRREVRVGVPNSLHGAAAGPP